MDRPCITHDKTGNAYKNLIGTPEENTSSGIPIGLRSWDDNIKKDVREIWFKVCNGFISLRTGTSGGLL
jgi:hypothetical protein